MDGPLLDAFPPPHPPVLGASGDTKSLGPLPPKRPFFEYWPVSTPSGLI